MGKKKYSATDSYLWHYMVKDDTLKVTFLLFYLIRAELDLYKTCL